MQDPHYMRVFFFPVSCNDNLLTYGRDSMIIGMEREMCMCSDDDILACLRSIEETLASDQYEYSGPYTVGGATGSYILRSPYNTECEWSIVSAIAVGTIGSAANFAIGSQNNKQPTLSSNGADSFGSIATCGTDTINALQSFVGTLTSQAPSFTYGDSYIPLPSPAIVYLQTATPASTEVLVTVQFRRKLLRYIPDKPRPRPHTHVIASRRPIRTLPAQSPMVAGYAAQYPRGGVPYQHQPLETQDTGVAKRGVFPLGGK